MRFFPYKNQTYYTLIRIRKKLSYHQLTFIELYEIELMNDLHDKIKTSWLGTGDYRNYYTHALGTCCRSFVSENATLHHA